MHSQVIYDLMCLKRSQVSFCRPLLCNMSVHKYVNPITYVCGNIHVSIVNPYVRYVGKIHFSSKFCLFAYCNFCSVLLNILFIFQGWVKDVYRCYKYYEQALEFSDAEKYCKV